MTLQPTQEQRAIMQARGRVGKINARAGTGKTTALRFVAESRPRRRGLYAVFNKRAQIRAEEVFPPHGGIR